MVEVDVDEKKGGGVFAMGMIETNRDHEREVYLISKTCCVFLLSVFAV